MPEYILRNDNGEQVGFVRATDDANALSYEAVQVFHFQEVPGGTHKLVRKVDGVQIGVVTVEEHTERDIDIEPYEEEEEQEEVDEQEKARRGIKDAAEKIGTLFKWDSYGGYERWSKVYTELLNIADEDHIDQVREDW